MFVDVSAKAGTNLDKLLEAIVLTADASLDLRANPNQDAQGIVIEAHLDRGRGPVATVLVQRGTLRVGDSIVAGAGHGRVRAMLDEHGENIEEADPASSGDGPRSDRGAGCRPDVHRRRRRPDGASDRRAARVARAGGHAGQAPRASYPRGLHGLHGEGRRARSSTSSSRATCPVRSRRSRTRSRRSTSATTSSIRVIDRGVGAITETNVDLAAASDAIIIGFNVRPAGQGDGDGGPRGRRDPLLLGHLPGDRGDRGGPQGHAQAGVRGVDPGPGGDPRDLPLVPARQHRGLHGHQRCHPAQREGARASATAPSWPTTSTSPRSSARRTTRPRSARASSAVWCCATSRTSRKAMSWRPSR